MTKADVAVYVSTVGLWIIRLICILWFSVVIGIAAKSDDFDDRDMARAVAVIMMLTRVIVVVWFWWNGLPDNSM